MNRKKIIKTLLFIFLGLLISINSSLIFATGTSSILNTDESLGIYRDLSDKEIRDYYSSIAKGTKGDSLLSNLQSILKDGQVKLNYTSGDTTSKAWSGYYLLERDWEKSPLKESEKGGNYQKSGIWVNILYSTESIYIENSINSGKYSYYDSDNKITKSFVSSKAQFDREHVLPKSFGFNGSGSSNYENLTAGCDMQNLHAGEHYGNSTGHNNLPYGTVENKTKDTEITSGLTGEVIGYKGKNKNNIDVFEPLDVDKGDIARTVFYMCARYHTYEELGGGDNTPAITLSDAAESISTLKPEDTKDNPVEYGELSDLLKWNKIDPVDEFEIHRNNLCYNAIQKNRNPFVDFPEWVDIAFADSKVGVDINAEDGIEGGAELNVSGSIDSIYTGESLDLSKISFSFKNSEGVISTLSLDDLTYQASILNVGIEIDDISTFKFTKPGNYTIRFTYEYEEQFYYKDLSFKVISRYRLEVENKDIIISKIQREKQLDLSNYIIVIYDKDSKYEVTDYKVKILDSNSEFVSDEKNYKFSKPGHYTIELIYDVEGEEVIYSYDLIVTFTNTEFIIIGVIAFIVVIIIVVIVIKFNKRHKKNSRSYKKCKAKNSKRK